MKALAKLPDCKRRLGALVHLFVIVDADGHLGTPGDKVPTTASCERLQAFGASDRNRDGIQSAIPQATGQRQLLNVQTGALLI